MNESLSLATSSAMLLWALAVVVSVLAAHVGLGWARLARRAPTSQPNQHATRALLLAGAALGTGLCSVAVLAQAAEVLSFPLGYHALGAFAMWLGAMLGSSAVAWVLARIYRWWAPLCGGVLLATLAAGVQAGWVVAAGYRPGVAWQTEYLAAGWLLLGVGLAAALWLEFSTTVHESGHRQLWRGVGTLVAGLTLTAAHQVLMVANGLSAQVGSVYLDEVPSTVLTLLCGVLVPLTLAVMAVDLLFRQPRRRQSNSGLGRAFVGRRQRKRHYSEHSR